MKLTLIILEDCPYCKRALRYINELKEEYPEFQIIEIETLEEEKQKELTASYKNYYYVPTFYFGKEKLHEGAIDKNEVKTLFQSLLKK